MAIEGLGQTSHIQHPPEVSMPVSQPASQSFDQLESATSRSKEQRSTLRCIWNWICKILCCLWCCDSKESPSKKPYLINLDSLKASLPNYEISLSTSVMNGRKNPGKSICFKGKDHEYQISFYRNEQKYEVFYADHAYQELPKDILQAIAIELKKSPERFSFINGMKWPLYDVTSKEFDVAENGGIEDVRYLAPKGIRYEIKDPFQENGVVGSAKVYFTTEQTEQFVDSSVGQNWTKIKSGMILVVYNSPGLRLAASEALLHRLIQDHNEVFLMEFHSEALLDNKFEFKAFDKEDTSTHCPLKQGFFVTTKPESN